MRVVANEKMIARNAQWGRYAQTIGFVLMIAALVINFLAISRPVAEAPNLIVYVLIAFMLGFFFSNLGTVLGQRWGRRSDRRLAEALKMLDDTYTLYNYELGAAHVLAGPDGLHVLIPKYQTGPVRYDAEKKRWLHASTMRRGLLGFGRSPDALGDPAAEAKQELADLQKFLKKNAPELAVEPQPLIIFMANAAQVAAKDAPVPVIHFKQLKDHFRSPTTKGSNVAQRLAAALDAKP